jgi:hypothetical protein
VAQACNPSYLGGRDQEDCSSNPAQENSSKKTLHKKRAGGVAQGEGPEFKPQFKKKRKEKEGGIGGISLICIIPQKLSKLSDC